MICIKRQIGVFYSYFLCAPLTKIAITAFLCGFLLHYLQFRCYFTVSIVVIISLNIYFFCVTFILFLLIKILKLFMTLQSKSVTFTCVVYARQVYQNYEQDLGSRLDGVA